MFLFNKKNEKVLSVLPLSAQLISNKFKQPNFYGVFFFSKAEGTIVVDQRQIDINNNDILFYYPYQKFSIKGEIEGSFIQFHPDFFCIDIHAKDIGCQGLLFNNFYNDILLRCSEREFKRLAKLTESIKKELKKKEIGQLDMVSSQLKILLINAVRTKLGKQKKGIRIKENAHHQLETLLDQYFAKESSPEFYAKELDVSLTKFNRLCKKYFQNSFITVLNLKKVARAKTKLFLTNASVKDIAYQIGFNDPLYFARVFKKYCGISPSDFRKKLKSDRLV